MLRLRLITQPNHNAFVIDTQEDGSVLLYGSPLALTGPPPVDGEIQPLSRVSVDKKGIHIYVDEWWTEQFKRLNDSAVSHLVGLIVAALWSYAKKDWKTAIAVDYVWNNIWPVIRQRLPDSFTIHIPWVGYPELQIWKRGSKYDGRRYRLSPIF